MNLTEILKYWDCDECYARNLYDQKMICKKCCHPKNVAPFEISNISITNNENKLLSITENQVSIVSFNLLSSEYFNFQVYKSSPSSTFDWSTRKKGLKRVIESIKKDIMCFQEMDSYFEYWQSVLQCYGYDSLYIQRPYPKEDGSCISWKKNKFQSCRVKKIYYDELAKIRGDDRYLKKNVGLLVELKSLVNNTVIIVANTHLFYNRGRERIQSDQAKMFVNEIKQFNVNNSPVLICGDFNTHLHSSVYDVICKEYDCLFEVVNDIPDVTAYYPKQILGLSDYIFLSKGSFIPTSYLKTPSVEEIKSILPIPSTHFPSDHFPVGCSLIIKTK